MKTPEIFQILQQAEGVITFQHDVGYGSLQFFDFVYNSYRGDKVVFPGNTITELKDLVTKTTNKLIKVEEEYDTFLTTVSSGAIGLLVNSKLHSDFCRFLSTWASQNNLTKHTPR